MNHFVFIYSISQGGVFESEQGPEESRDKLNRELGLMYGPDLVTVTDFRPATQQEIEQYEKDKAEYQLEQSGALPN